MPLFCWFHHFLDSRAEICQMFFVGILVQMMTPKGHFETNWPLSFKEFFDKWLHLKDRVCDLYIFWYKLIPLAFSWSRNVKSILFFTNSFALAAYSTMLIWPFRLTSSVFIKTSISFCEGLPIFWFSKNAFK